MTIKRRITKLENELLRVALETYRSGGGSEEVKREMKRVLKRHNISKQMVEQMHSELQEIVRRTHAEALKRYDHILKFTASPLESASGIAITEAAATSFAQTEEGIQREVVDAVAEAARQQLGHKAITGILHQKMRKPLHHAQTISNTATAGFQTAASMQTEARAGVTKWKYSGPPGERSFCQSHLGKSYSMRDIKKLNNGQGLDVYLYRGGWNCRHMWIAEPVTDVSPRRIQRAKQEYDKATGNSLSAQSDILFHGKDKPTGEIKERIEKGAEEGFSFIKQHGRGYVQYHDSWLKSLEEGNAERKRIMKDEEDTALKFSNADPDIAVALRVGNTNTKGGDHDVLLFDERFGAEIWRKNRGRITSLSTIKSKLNKGQSNMYILHFGDEVKEAKFHEYKFGLQQYLKARYQEKLKAGVHESKLPDRDLYLLWDGNPNELLNLF